MDFIKSQIVRIQEQLGGLGASQKMLAGALVVIMAMTLFYWGAYAGKAEMAVLLDVPLQPEQVQRIAAYLDGRGFRYEVGDRVRVPADKRFEILAALQYMEMLPEDTNDAFNELIAQSGPWDSNSKQEKMWNQYKQTMLGQIIRKMPRVRSATVLIDARNERGPNRNESSATVHVQLAAGEKPDAKLVKAAADLVAGAVAGMRRSRVIVIVNDVSYPQKDRDPNAPAMDGESWVARAQEGETFYKKKVLDSLPPIEGLVVQVGVKPNHLRTETVEQKIDAKNVVSKPVVDETYTEDNQNAARASEPGIIPNGGLSITDNAAAEGSSNTSEKNRSEFVVAIPRSDTKTFDPGGDIAVTGASVMIPRSYFIQVYQAQFALGDKEPEDAVLAPFIAQTVTRWKTSVKNVLPGVAAEDVHIDSYVDLRPVATGIPQVASTTVSLLVTDYAKEIALGALALVSLFMVSTMVRKGAPVPAASSATPPRAVSMLKNEADDAIGEASEGGALLDAIELDPDSVRAQEMLNQVSDMVNENPDGAASLVKRWLNR